MIIRSILIFHLSLLFFHAFAIDNFSKIDKRSKSVPDSIHSISQIAKHLTKNLSTDVEKTRAIYIWVSSAIQYDLKLMNSNTRYVSTNEIVDEVLLTRKGICQHYADLFNTLCQTAGVKSYSVSGYTKDAEEKIANLSHAWNAVVIDTTMYFIDATWAAGYLDNNKYIHKFRDDYFLINAKEFIKTHMPFDPIWQGLNNPINNLDFKKNDLSKLKVKGSYNFRDSIEKTKNQTQLANLLSSKERIIELGTTNNLIDLFLAEIELKITNIQFNQAIDTMNYGINHYNTYVAYRNKQFRAPKISDNELKQLMADAKKGIYTSNILFQKLSSNDETMNESILENRSRMPKLIYDLKNENEFLTKYLKTWKPFRMFKFYSFSYY